MIGTYTRYRYTIDHLKDTRDRLLQEPVVSRETTYYIENIKKVRTIDEFLSDDRLYDYAMKAYGLGEMIYAKGLMRKLLTDPEMADKMSDKRYAEFVKAFNFHALGEKATQSVAAVKGAVNKYIQQTLEEEMGKSDPGVRLALYFTRIVGGMQQGGGISKKGWAYQILGDKALTQVVFTALGIPNSIRKSDVDVQKRLLETHLSFEDIVTPEGVERLISRFSAMYDKDNNQPVSAALALLKNSAPNTLGGFSLDSLEALQALRRH